MFKAGYNDELAGRLRAGVNLRALSGGLPVDMVKLVVFVPENHVQSILKTLSSLGVGHIGNYADCTFRSQGIGTFTPGADAKPERGAIGRLNEVEEARIEVQVTAAAVDRVVTALKAVHPYETMAHDVYPLSLKDPEIGLGRIGSLPEAVALEELARQVKQRLGLGTVKTVGDPKMTVRRVAVCSGSGGSLLGAAIGAGAQVFVSGDLSYHTARDAQQAGIGLIDAGHFGTEQLIVPVLAKAIAAALRDAGIEAVVTPAELETDPFDYGDS